MQPTQEQLDIGTSIANGVSVIVNAVAGSGKTTTILSVAARLPEARILQVTYNTALRLDVRQKVADRGIANVEVHTYHSAARAYYDETTTTDMGIEASLGMDPRDLPPFDVVIVDECQDMTPLLYAFARKLVADLPRPPVIGLFGDDMQTIYQFKRADPRFLTLGDQLWPGFAFARHSLSESFRISNAMAGFVNANLLGYEKILARKPGPPVNIAISKSAADTIIPLIFRLFQTGVRASDIFVLAPSLNENSRAFIAVENALVIRNVAVHIPNQEDRTLDDDVMRNKVVFSTFHQSKGRERKVAIVLGIDGDYAKTFARDIPETQCPSTAYVACTRAADLLVIAQKEGAGCPRFMNVENTENVEVHGGALEHAELSDAPVLYRPKRTKVTKLVRHVSHELVTKLHDLITPIIETVAPPGDDVAIPAKVLTKYRSYEDVSDINAHAISAMFEMERGLDTPTILDSVRGARLTPFLESYVEGLPKEYTKPEHFLYLANVYKAVDTRQYFRLKQITNHKWIKAEQAELILQNYRRHVGAVDDFEYPVAVNGYKVGDSCTDVVGYIDIVTPTDVFEIKCTQQLQIEHVIQLVLYKWLWAKSAESTRGPRDFKLLNVMTGECIRVKGTDDEIEKIASLLIREKNLSTARPSDIDFVSTTLAT